MNASLSGAVVTKPQVLAVARRVADWQLFSGRSWTMPTKEPRVWKNTEWGATALWVGVLEFYKITGDQRYLDTVMRVGAAAGWQPQQQSFNADFHSIGQVYLDLYALAPKPEMIKATRSLMDAMVARQETPVLDITRPGAKAWWSWSDALFMSPPVLFRLAQVTGERKYFEYADQHWWRTVDLLYDSEEHLLYRDVTAKNNRSSRGRKVFWARGDGWVFAALARIIPSLPADAPSRLRYEKLFQEMAQRLIEIQRPDGYWTPSLLEPEAFPQGETSGTAFFCYGLAWGLNRGLLKGDPYRQAVERAWKGLADRVKADGRLTGVQPVGSAPAAFDPETSDIYGVGAFLLAASEVSRVQ